MGFLSSAVTVVESLQDLSLAVELTRVGVLTERNSPLDFELAVGPTEWSCVSGKLPSVFHTSATFRGRETTLGADSGAIGDIRFAAPGNSTDAPSMPDSILRAMKPEHPTECQG